MLPEKIPGSGYCGRVYRRAKKDAFSWSGFKEPRAVLPSIVVGLASIIGVYVLLGAEEMNGLLIAALSSLGGMAVFIFLVFIAHLILTPAKLEEEERGRAEVLLRALDNNGKEERERMQALLEERDARIRSFEDRLGWRDIDATLFSHISKGKEIVQSMDNDISNYHVMKSKQQRENANERAQIEGLTLGLIDIKEPDLGLCNGRVNLWKRDVVLFIEGIEDQLGFSSNDFLGAEPKDGRDPILLDQTRAYGISKQLALVYVRILRLVERLESLGNRRSVDSLLNRKEH